MLQLNPTTVQVKFSPQNLWPINLSCQSETLSGTILICRFAETVNIADGSKLLNVVLFLVIDHE